MIVEHQQQMQDEFLFLNHASRRIEIVGGPDTKPSSPQLSGRRTAGWYHDDRLLATTAHDVPLFASVRADYTPRRFSGSIE